MMSQSKTMKLVLRRKHRYVRLSFGLTRKRKFLGHL